MPMGFIPTTRMGGRGPPSYTSEIFDRRKSWEQGSRADHHHSSKPRSMGEKVVKEGDLKFSGNFYGNMQSSICMLDSCL
jgi:hypothetical protein